MPQQMEYAALGLFVVGACGLLFWALMRRAVKRATAEGQLDDRMVKIVDAIQSAANQTITAIRQNSEQQSDLLRQIIDEERSEKRRAQDERETLTKEFISYSTTVQAQHDTKVESLRLTHDESMKRIGERLQKCELGHQSSAAEAEYMRGRLHALEQRLASAPPATMVVTAPFPAAGAPSQPPG